MLQLHLTKNADTPAIVVYACRAVNRMADVSSLAFARFMRAGLPCTFQQCLQLGILLLEFSDQAFRRVLVDYCIVFNLFRPVRVSQSTEAFLIVVAGR